MRNAIETGQMSLALPPERRVFRVSELNAAVQRRFESDFRSIWVAGEIFGCRMPNSGHFYFSLKDEQSQVKCALFRGNARYAKFRPQDGLAVIARGNLEVYEARGEYQLIVDLLEPQGAGALQLAFEQLKRKLALEGLFEQERKRPLPKYPKRLGIVTSPDGAVIRDMLHVLERRFPGLQIRLHPAQVQGEGSAEHVCRAIRFFSQGDWAEVVILARGGGSLEDLWTFNEESVARAIAACSKPVISAIGHETDFTIADFVADVRAPTPSAAAEIVICTRESLLAQVEELRQKMLQSLRYRLLMSSHKLRASGTDRAVTVTHRGLTRRAQLLDELDDRLRHASAERFRAVRNQYAEWTRRLEATDLRLRLTRQKHQRELLEQRIQQIMEVCVRRTRNKLESLDLHLRQLSPLTILSRGYAIVEDQQKHVLRDAAQAAPGDPILIRLHRGHLDATITETRPPAPNDDARSYT